MSEKLTDEEFIASARKACRNSIMSTATGAYPRYSIMSTATGAYLDEALQRLERANALIDDIKAQVNCGGVKHVGRIYSMIEEWEQQ